MDAQGLPLLKAPHDALRDGLVTLKDGASTSHPVEAILSQGKAEQAAKLEMLRNVYGPGLPARLQIEQQILDRHQRLPGLTSSRLGLESLTGRLDEFGPESYLGLPSESEVPQPDLHSSMEARLKLGTKPCARGML